jgi:hypothetical protein
VLRDRFLANSASSRTNVLCTKCLYLKALKPLAQVWYTGGGAFGRWLGHEGGALINDTRALIRGLGDLSCSSCHIRTQWEDSFYESGSRSEGYWVWLRPELGKEETFK